MRTTELVLCLLEIFEKPSPASFAWRAEHLDFDRSQIWACYRSLRSHQLLAELRRPVDYTRPQLTLLSLTGDGWRVLQALRTSGRSRASKPRPVTAALRMQ